jgi:very-short-patch-repair endonuclease
MIKIFDLLIVILILGIIFIYIEIKTAKVSSKIGYRYKRKDFFMSRAEHECYNVLLDAVGDKYYVFPQVHLPTLIDNKIKGQNWKGAFSHISQKSVDFALCDKSYISPKLAIELDDKTHERIDRVIRDEEVERIFKEIGLPLLRIKNNGQFNTEELLKEINTALNNGEHRS